MTIFNEKIVNFGYFQNIKISAPKNIFHEKIDLCPKIHPLRCTHAKYERAGAKIERARPKSRYPIFDYFFIFFFSKSDLDHGSEPLSMARSDLRKTIGNPSLPRVTQKKPEIPVSLSVLGAQVELDLHIWHA